MRTAFSTLVRRMRTGNPPARLTRWTASADARLRKLAARIAEEIRPIASVAAIPATIRPHGASRRVRAARSTK
jgi:hypothetical protein